MHRRINIIVTLSLTAVLFFSSCNDWLELKPENYVIKQEFWKTKQQVHSAVMGCYASLLEDDIARRYFLWGEIRADMLTYNNGISWDNLVMLFGYVRPYNSVLKWESMYKSINICNTVINYAHEALETDPTFTESELKSYEAEALALRSLLYFYLVRSFGEVPLMLNAITSDQEEFFVPKSADTVIINQIINDLKIAEQSAPESYEDYDHTKGRITKYAVNAIQADVYLWNEDYEECVQACDKIINSGKYGLVSGDQWFQEIYATGNSNESIFELQFSAEKPNPYYNYFHPTSGDQQFLASYVATELYEDEDVRGDSATLWLENKSAIYKYLGLSNIENLYRTSAGSYAHWIFYRYAEILLLKAEALSQQEKGTEAVALIHRIQQRAKASETSVDADDYDAIIDLLLLEKQKEFAYEGKRWYDILRNAKRDNYRRKEEVLYYMIENYASADLAELLKNKYSDNRSHYFPIYYREIELNPELEQNSYYAY